MKLVVAVPTRGRLGLDDVAHEVFARAPYFTILEVSKEECKVKEVIENEYRELSHGVGPLVVKLLKDRGVDVIALPEAGIGVKQLSQELGISSIEVEAGTKVGDLPKLVLRFLEG